VARHGLVWYEIDINWYGIGGCGCWVGVGYQDASSFLKGIREEPASMVDTPVPLSKCWPRQQPATVI